MNDELTYIEKLRIEIDNIYYEISKYNERESLLGTVVYEKQRLRKEESLES